MAERTPEEIAAAKRRLEEAGLEVTDKMIEAEIKLREAAARTLETREKNLEALEEQLAKLEGLIEKDADGDFARRERKKALAALAMKAYRDEIAIIEERIRKEAFADDEAKKRDFERLEALRRAEKGVDNVAAAQHKANEMMSKGSDMWENKFTVALMSVGRIIAEGGIINALDAGFSKLAQNGIMRVVGGVKDMVFALDESTKGFEKQFQMGERFTQQLLDQHAALIEVGATIKEVTAANAALIPTFTDFTMLSDDQSRIVGDSAIVLEQLGVANDDFAKGMQNATKFFGQSAMEAESTQRELAATARALGVAPGALASQFANAGGAFAKFGENGVKAFKDLARISKLTGMEMEKVLSITNRFDTFEGAAEATGQLNAALGGNFVNAMDMLMDTDPATRFESIRDSILGAGLSFDEMSYYQKQFYTEALGLSDVGDLAMMLSGNMDDLAGATNKSAEELIAEKERAKEVQTAQENLQITLALLSETFARDFLPVLQKSAKFLSENAGFLQLALGFFALYKIAAAGAAVAQVIYTNSIIAGATAEKAIARSRMGAVATIVLLAAAITLLVASLMIESPSKVVLALFGVAAGIFAISRVGETGAASLQALAVPLIQIAASIFVVSAGLALMSYGFSLLSVPQMLAMSAALTGIGIGIYFLTPALTALGAALANPMVAVGLGLFALTILSIGASVFIAASGIGLMATGFAQMFEAINLQKMLAFGAFAAALVIGAPFFGIAGLGLAAMSLGMGALAFSLAFIKTRDLEAIAQFATGLAELEVNQVTALANAIREVAKAMDEVDPVKAVFLKATMESVEVATKTARVLAGQQQTTQVAAAANSQQQPININLTVELDGEVLERKIVRTVTDEQGSGGAFSFVDQLMGR